MLHSVAKILEDSDNSFKSPTGRSSLHEIDAKQQSAIRNETVLKQCDGTTHSADRVTSPGRLDKLLCVINGHFDLSQQCSSSSVLDNGLQKCLDKYGEKMFRNESREWDSKLYQLLPHSFRCFTGGNVYSVSYQDNLSEFVGNQSPARRTNNHFKEASYLGEQDCSTCGNGINVSLVFIFVEASLENSFQSVDVLSPNEASTSCGMLTDSIHQVQSRTSTMPIKPFRLKVLSDSGHYTVKDKELRDICEFARYFKFRRLTMGLTQTQVCLSLNAKEGSAYSQSAICRCD
ncbi:POU domain protein [Fasciolopsis buskii]|uniref:POU domain protein n=1 Tax=Fasciolopsis buskii TaxID=27845 RepID=A0A8E0RNZ1_9TREM|nr:POU domain protein [Fasciolopsis buski]